jgi:hypothetical protein
MSRKLAAALIFLSGVLLVIGAFEVIHYRSPVSRPLGEAPRIEFHPAQFSELEKQHFLDGNFKIVKDVRALPSSVLQTFTERDGLRLLIANPGQKFEVTDVIDDASVPRERLIFAGVAGDKCFIHYEKGGYAHSYILEIFGPTSTGKVGPLYGSYCDAPATNFQDLRSSLTHGGCSHPMISR